jgi:hypothetical protein
MSLDISLTLPGAQLPVPLEQIWIRAQGQTRQISRAAWHQRHPEREPVTLTPTHATTDEVYHANITHNLGAMAAAAGLYQVLWRPEELGLTQAQQLIEPLRAGLRRLAEDPAPYEAVAPANGWGTYAQLVAFVTAYLAACVRFPAAEVRVWR